MMHRSRSMTAALTAGLGLSLIAVATPLASAADVEDYVTVATGLDNPRQLSVGPGQRLYVAEAGNGEACEPIPGVPDDFLVCGFTGAVTEIDRSSQRRVVTGLPTLSFQGEIMGASEVDVRGNTVTVLVGGLAGATAAQDAAEALDAGYAMFGTLRTGRLQSPSVTGASLSEAADLAGYEVANNPDGNDPVDSNATGFAALNSKNWAVTDAGGNALLTVGSNGEQTVAVFPDGEPVPNPFGPGLIPPQAVPTDVVVGPDGAYYVSQLTGFPFPTGGSTIWRVTRGGDVSAYATGLTMVTSLAWKGNTLYAVQLDDGNFFDGHVGSLRKVTAGGSEHDAVTSELSAPYGVAIRGNSAFVTIDSISSGGGSVIEVSLR